MKELIKKILIESLDFDNTFKPIIGMVPKDLSAHGYQGKIEHVGADYFILRSFKTNEPVLIKTFQYHNFKDYHLPEN